jgi:cell division protein FtsW (lipid II flippase)
MIVTDDMGPLLVSAYGAGIFLAAAVTYILQLRGLPKPLAHVGGLAVLCAWFASLTQALFTLGQYGSTVAVRLESAALPLVSRNDQISIITWFRKATPEWGYGVGGIPWCGYAGAGHCRGVPLQIHSDYTFTALWGMFGAALACGFAVSTVMWLYLVIRRHGRATSGTLVATRQNGVWTIQTQAFLSWVCVTWLILSVCQIVVTVAGNLRLLPLTGITYPFVSYGKTSLWVNAILIGLSMSIDVAARPAVRKS